MSDIVLVRARHFPSLFIRRGDSAPNSGRCSPPYGILSIAGALQRQGLSVRIMDRYHPSYFSLSSEQMAEVILQDRPSVIGISALTSQSQDALALARAIRTRQATPVVCGGSHFCHETAGDFLNAGVAVLVGEGEKTLPALLAQGPQAVTGLLHGQPVTAEEMDAIPFPTARQLEETGFDPTMVKEFPIMTARGCPFGCVFCKDGHRSSVLRYHSVDYVVNALESIHKAYGYQRFFIQDDVFVYSLQRMEEMIHALEARGLKLNFRCFLHPNTVRPESLKLMRRLGVDAVSIGIESGNEEIQKILGKKTSLDKIRQAVDLCKAEGFYVAGLFMLGNIGETVTTMMDTLRFAWSLPTDEDYFSYAIPFPGTPFYDQVATYGRIMVADTSLWNNKQLVYLPNGVSFAQMRSLMLLAQFERRGKNLRWLLSKVKKS